MPNPDGYTLTSRMRKARREYPLTSTEQALYYELIAICNEGGWNEVFSCSCAELCCTLQITGNTLVKARMALINAGLISYKSGKSKRQFSTYSLLTTSKIDTDVGTDKGRDKGTDEGRDSIKKLSTKENSTNKTETKQELALAYSSDEFAETWKILRSEKKWKNKSPAALSESMNKLARHPEDIAIEMMKNAIAGGWQGVFDLKPVNGAVPKKPIKLANLLEKNTW
jgi:hypothetical protein